MYETVLYVHVHMVYYMFYLYVFIVELRTTFPTTVCVVIHVGFHFKFRYIVWESGHKSSGNWDCL